MLQKSEMLSKLGCLVRYFQRLEKSFPSLEGMDRKVQ